MRTILLIKYFGALTLLTLLALPYCQCPTAQPTVAGERVDQYGTQSANSHATTVLEQTELAAEAEDDETKSSVGAHSLANRSHSYLADLTKPAFVLYQTPLRSTPRYGSPILPQRGPPLA